MNKTRKWPTRAMHMLIALALVLSFSVVAVVPVVDAAGASAASECATLEVGTYAGLGGTDGVASWTKAVAGPITPPAGTYMAKLVYGATNPSTAAAKVPYSGTLTALSTLATADESGMTFNYYYVDTGKNPYAVLYLDTDSDGVADMALLSKQLVPAVEDAWNVAHVTTNVGGNGGWHIYGYAAATCDIDGATGQTIKGISYDSNDWKTLAQWAALTAGTTTFGDDTAVLWVGYMLGGNGGTGHIAYVDDITIGTKTYELDPARIENSVGTLLPTVPDASSFYVHVTSPASNAQPAVVDTLTVSLDIYDGVAIQGGCVTPISTTSYTATETGKDTSEFWTDAISTTDLGVRPGYKLVSSWEGGSLPVFIQAEVSFDKSYYDVGEYMTITVKDDTANINAIGKNTLNDIANAEIGWVVAAAWQALTGLTAVNFVETGVDTGVFTCTTKPSTQGFAIGDLMEIHYGNPKYLTTDTADNHDVGNNQANVTNGSDEEVKATAGVLLKSDSSVAFNKGTYSATATSAIITVTDPDKNTAAGTKQTISGNPVIVEDVTTGDSITIASLVETGIDTGAFRATIYFGTGTGKLPINDGDQLKATYTDPTDAEDVSTGTAAVGYTVELYNASDVLVNSYTTIEAAVAASTGNNDYTVVVKSGYASSDENWPITINTGDTGLTIKAEDGATVTINPALQTGYAGGDAFDVVDDDVTIEGLTIQNSYNAAAVTLFDVDNTGFILKDCTVDLTANSKNDIGVDLAGVLVVTITGCAFNVDAGDTLGVGDTAIVTISTGTTTVKNCAFTGSSGIGVNLNVAAGTLTVQGSTFDGLDKAINVANTCTLVTVKWNSIVNSAKATVGAIHIADAVKIIIAGNDIKDNLGYPVFFVDGADFTELVFNNIVGNAKGVRNDDVGKQLSATHNWWGTADGPSASDIVGLAADFDTDYYLTAPVELTASYEGPAVAQANFNFKVATGVKVSASAAIGYAGAAEYTESPKAALADASFYDVFIDPTGLVAASTVTVSFYTEGLTADSVAYFWNGLTGAWELCSNQGFNSYEGYIWVLARDQAATVPTSPTIQELTGGMFAITGEPVVIPESIDATPASVSLGVGGTQALTVTATYSDDSTADVTATSTYVSDDETAATVSAAGLITAVAEGLTTINVSYTEGGVTKTDTVAVSVSEEVTLTELLDAIENYLDGTLDLSALLAVISAYLSGSL